MICDALAKAALDPLQDNRIFFAHDFGDWHSGRGRSTHGRFVQITVDPK